MPPPELSAGRLLLPHGLFYTVGGATLYVAATGELNSTTLALPPFRRLPIRVELLNLPHAKLTATTENFLYQSDLPPVLRLRNISSEALAGTVPVFKLTFDGATGSDQPDNLKK